jgi:hypothetical protein
MQRVGMLPRASSYDKERFEGEFQRVKSLGDNGDLFFFIDEVIDGNLGAIRSNMLAIQKGMVYKSRGRSVFDMNITNVVEGYWRTANTAYQFILAIRFGLVSDLSEDLRHTRTGARAAALQRTAATFLEALLE